MLKSGIPALLLLFLLPACTPEAVPAKTTSCIDASKIRKDAMCTMEYAPVCGCDGKTYSNACAATNAGVTSFTQGQCPGSKTN